MGLVLEYVRQTGAGRFEYRRRVPKDVSENLGKREFKKVLGETRAEALLHYLDFHRSVESEIASARGRQKQLAAAQRGELGGIELWRLAQQHVAAIMGGQADDHDLRDSVADSILDRYPRAADSDEEEGGPIGVSPLDRMIANILRNPRSSPPAPTLEDALRQYQRDMYGDEPSDADVPRLQREERALAKAKAALETLPPLIEMKREDARKIMEFIAAQP